MATIGGGVVHTKMTNAVFFDSTFGCNTVNQEGNLVYATDNSDITIKNSGWVGENINTSNLLFTDTSSTTTTENFTFHAHSCSPPQDTTSLCQVVYVSTSTATEPPACNTENSAASQTNGRMATMTTTTSVIPTDLKTQPGTEIESNLESSNSPMIKQISTGSAVATASVICSVIFLLIGLLVGAYCGHQATVYRFSKQRCLQPHSSYHEATQLKEQSFQEPNQTPGVIQNKGSLGEDCMARECQY